jgi:hypothetical protein
MKKIILYILLIISTDLLSQVTIVKEDVKCKGADDGTLSALYNNAAEPVKSFIWSDGYSGQFHPNVGAGDYCVTVTDANNCTAVECITVLEPESALRLSLRTEPYHLQVPCGAKQPLWLIAEASGGHFPYKINGKPGITRTFFIPETQTVKIILTDDRGCTIEREQKIYILPKICSKDPNEIVGPAGIDSVRWVSVRDTLDYTIKFENDPEFATAPAQRVTITHAFDEDINPYSFRLGTFGFGDYLFEVPENVAYYQKRFDLQNEIGLFLDVVAGLNVATQTAFWTFESIDPSTGLTPIDPLLGFLPINDTITKGGEGFVNFSARPYLPGHTGDTAHATAEIIFDINEPLVTNTWTNWIDAVPPTTELDPLDPTRHSRLIELFVSGSDDVNGSGLSHYELWISKNGSLFQKHEQTIADTLESYVFEGEYATSYAFYIIGVDRTGNKEIKNAGEAFTEVFPRKEIYLLYPLADEYCIGDTLWMEWEAISIDSVDVFVSLDSGMTFLYYEGPYGPMDTVTYLVLNDTLANQYVQIRYQAHLDTFETYSTILPIKPLPDVNAGLDKSVCIGGYTFLIPDGANIYQWSPDLYINNPNLTIPTVMPDSTTEYFVEGIDVFGCRNMDSMIVHIHPLYLDSVIHAMCNQDSVFVGGAYQTEPGYYTDELVSVFGCDSTVVTEVVLTGPCTFPSPYVYVDKDATGLNNGTSWANAFHELSDALRVAAEYIGADEIWMAEGIYKPHPSLRDSSFVLHDSIKIYGGFLGVEESLGERSANAELVHLSGDINIQDTLWDNSYHTVRYSSLCEDCLIDGVTITYGHADLPDNSNDIGAGVLNQGKGKFSNVIFERNYSTEVGSALHSSGASADLIIESCIFRLNTSSLGRDVVNTDGAVIEFRGANSIH